MNQFFFPSTTYINRRKTLRQLLGQGRILLIGNDDSSINFKDNWYHFRQDSTFLYYIGINLPGLKAVIDIDNEETILFGDNLTIDDIVWTGDQPSLESLAAKAGINKVLPTDQILRHLSSEVHYLPPYRPEHTLKINSWVGENSSSSIPLIKAVVKQRSIKDQEEIDQLHIAATATSKMHRAVIEACRPGMKENDLVAVAQKVVWKNNLQTSFPPILTIDGQVLHNHYYGNSIKDGDMVLFDGGIESQSGYAGDMTRTFPGGKKFTERQAELYNIVHESHSRAVAALKTGIRFLDVHRIASEALVEGLARIGVMKGNPQEAVEAGAHTMFFQCGLGHMMGLDVHDMENLGEEYVGYTENLIKGKEFGWKSLRLGRELEEGFVLTVEPGIYIIPQLIEMWKVDKKYDAFINYNVLESYKDFGGIRIEDDYVITSEGSELLGEPLARSLTEIEEMRSY